MQRRQFFQSLAAAPLALRAGFSATAKPNIIMLLADDLGYGDLSLTGCPDVQTPHIDRLAAEGVQFTHAYCNGPVCSPTRAALMTGQYQQRNGMDKVILVNERERGLNLNAVLLPQVLKPAGYVSGIFGKWHLGFRKEYFPTRRGFDEFIGFLAGNIDYFSHSDRLNNPDLWKNEQPFKDDRYMTDLIAGESISFIDRHRNQPFFLYVPFNAVHDPYQGPKDRDTAGDQVKSRKSNRTRAVYRTMIESLDQNVGRIMAHLKARSLDQNTLVFFMSDNGGVPKIGRNLPFSGFKGSLWEGGIRTPFIARWTGHFPAGAKRSDMVAAMDILPTCAAAAGAKIPAGTRPDGVSLLEACRSGARLKRDTIYFHSNKQEAVVRSGWKYLRDNEGEEHLFQLAEDITEKNDLKAKAPDRLTAMKRDYQAWLKDVFAGSPEASGER